MAYCVRGFHVYGDVWTPSVEEIHVCEREDGNPSDLYEERRQSYWACAKEDVRCLLTAFATWGSIALQSNRQPLPIFV